MTSIMIIDLDGTIIGNITYQMMANNMLMRFNNGKGLGEIKKMYKEDTGLVRNGFIQCMEGIREIYPDILIYVYTASVKSWAYKQIKWIESNSNFKFNRPILTREDCVLVGDKVFKSIKKVSKKTKHDKAHNILVIDNNDVFIDRKDKFIKCPDYNTITFIDLWKLMKPNMMTDKDCITWIKKMIQLGHMNPTFVNNSKNNTDILKLIKYHQWYVQKYKEIAKNNKKYLNDTFWIDLLDIFKTQNIKNLSDVKRFMI